MMRPILHAAAAAAALAVPHTASAVELTSAWITALGATDELRCRVVNVGKKPITVVADLIDSNGASIVDNFFGGCDGSAPLPPGGFCSVLANGSNAAYCKITSKSSKVRGVLTLGPDAANPTLALPVTR
jgi:hypothetical protein